MIARKTEAAVSPQQCQVTTTRRGLTTGLVVYIYFLSVLSLLVSSLSDRAAFSLTYRLNVHMFSYVSIPDLSVLGPLK